MGQDGVCSLAGSIADRRCGEATGVVCRHGWMRDVFSAGRFHRCSAVWNTLGPVAGASGSRSLRAVALENRCRSSQQYAQRSTVTRGPSDCLSQLRSGERASHDAGTTGERPVSASASTHGSGRGLVLQYSADNGVFQFREQRNHVLCHDPASRRTRCGRIG